MSKNGTDKPPQLRRSSRLMEGLRVLPEANGRFAGVGSALGEGDIPIPRWVLNDAVNICGGGTPSPATTQGGVPRPLEVIPEANESAESMHSVLDDGTDSNDQAIPMPIVVEHPDNVEKADGNVQPPPSSVEVVELDDVLEVEGRAQPPVEVIEVEDTEKVIGGAKIPSVSSTSFSSLGRIQTEHSIKNRGVNKPIGATGDKEVPVSTDTGGFHSSSKSNRRRQKRFLNRNSPLTHRPLTSLRGDQKSIFVANLNYFMDESAVFEYFRACGNIKDVVIKRDRFGNSLGQAFVEFADQQSVHRALKLNGSAVKGRKLTVRINRKSMARSIINRTNVPSPHNQNGGGHFPNYAGWRPIPTIHEGRPPSVLPLQFHHPGMVTVPVFFTAPGYSCSCQHPPIVIHL